MKYNTELEPLIIPEYGRHIHSMANSLHDIKDRKKRNQQAQVLINIMGNLNPHLRDVDEYKHKLWDHLYIMCNNQLDIDAPYPKPEKGKKILSYKPSQVLGIEISESYRESLENKFKHQNVVILANDAKELNNVVSDSSVDKLLAVNVVYFLEPLESYVNEFYRIIKKGGEGIIACKFHGVASFDDSVAVNKDIDFVTSSFEKGGFSVSHTNVDLGSDFSKYTAITIKK